MSWSFGTTNVAADSIVESLEAARDEKYEDEQLDADVDEQIDEAIATIAQLVASGTLGAVETFNVSLSGHANPGHRGAEGRPNDSIAVAVSVVSYRDDADGGASEA